MVAMTAHPDASYGSTTEGATRSPARAPVDIDAVREAQARLKCAAGEDPTLREVADDLGCSPAVVLSLLASQSAERWGTAGGPRD